MQPNTIYNEDCVSYLSKLDDQSVDLFIVDPPYYKVVNDKWDHQWFTFEEYVEWCENWISEMGRVSKWSGSVWLFGFPHQLMHMLPLMNAAGFTFKQQIIINKGMQAVAGRTSSKLKMFPTATESAFFFYKDARDHVRDLLQAGREKLNWKGKDVNAYLGKATSGGGTFACIASHKKPKEHRVLPTREDWTKLSEIMDLPEYDDTVYKFNITSGLTDVWDDINFYDRSVKKFHSTQKPLKLIERLINTSSNEGDLVCDPFMGSGSTAISCMNTDRVFTGCEIDEKYFGLINERIQTHNPLGV